MQITTDCSLGSGCNGAPLSAGIWHIKEERTRSELEKNSFPNYDHGYWTVTDFK